MFFFFSKILEFFIYPFSWVIILSATAIIVKKPHVRRRLILICAVILLLFSNAFLLNQFAKRWDIQPISLKNTGPYSCAVILGGFASEDANGNGMFTGAADRFIQGLKLFTTGKVTHILISGGNGNLIHDSFKESDWVKTQLQLFKVPDSCILIDDRSRNTLENAAFSKTILTARHLQPPYILVTSAFHMRRSLGIFKDARMEVIPYPCNYFAGTGNISAGDFVPDPAIFGSWNIYIKEAVGTLVNQLR